LTARICPSQSYQDLSRRSSAMVAQEGLASSSSSLAHCERQGPGRRDTNPTGTRRMKNLLFQLVVRSAFFRWQGRVHLVIPVLKSSARHQAFGTYHLPCRSAMGEFIALNRIAQDCANLADPGWIAKIESNHGKKISQVTLLFLIE